MKHFRKNLSVLLLFLGMVSCNKPGLNGDATIVVFPQHHGIAVKNHIGWPDTVYVKFNASEFPGANVGDYNTYFVGNTGEESVSCNGLKWGNYYLYVVGIDSAGPYRVKGGLAIKIKYKERKKNINLNIQITE